MKLVMSISLRLLFVFFAFCADVTLADDAACHAAPTRECVIEIAIDRAVVNENPNLLTSGLLQIAEFQLSYDPTQSQHTFDLMMTLLEKREPDAYERAQVLGRRTYGGGDLFRASPTRLRVIAEMELLATQLRGEELVKTHESLWKLTRFTGNEEAMRSAWAVAGPDVSETDLLHLLGYFAIVNNDNAQLAEIVARMPDELDRSELFNAGAIYFAQKGNVWVATSYADAIENRTARADTLLTIALVLLEAGFVDDVRALLARPDFPTTEMSRHFGRPLAYIHAHLGDRDEMERNLRLEEGRWTVGRYVYRLEPEDLRNLAALMNDDYQTYVTAAILEEKPHVRREMMRFEDGVYRQLGSARVDVFLDHLTPELLVHALESYGSYQAKTGDVSGALATLARLDEMPADMRRSSELDRTLSAALARDGQYQAALARAAEFDTSYQYFSIAREIHANTNP